MTTRILVVNDDAGLINLFTSVLNDEGYTATGLNYGHANPVTIARLEPALIILDLMVGGETQGWALLSKLRLHKPTAATPVIVCVYFPPPEVLYDPHLRERNVRVVAMPPDLTELLTTVVQTLNEQ